MFAMEPNRKMLNTRYKHWMDDTTPHLSWSNNSGDRYANSFGAQPHRSQPQRKYDRWTYGDVRIGKRSLPGSQEQDAERHTHRVRSDSELYQSEALPQYSIGWQPAHLVFYDRRSQDDDEQERYSVADYSQQYRDQWPQQTQHVLEVEPEPRVGHHSIRYVAEKPELSSDTDWNAGYWHRNHDGWTNWSESKS